MESHKLFYALIICVCVVQTTCQENQTRVDETVKSVLANKEDVKNLVKSFQPIFEKFSNPIMGILQWSIILELLVLPFAQALSDGNINSSKDIRNLVDSLTDFLRNIPLNDITSLLMDINKAIPSPENVNLNTIGSFLDKLADIVQKIGKVLQKALDRTKKN